jgi:hypothetical protein
MPVAMPLHELASTLQQKKKKKKKKKKKSQKHPKPQRGMSKEHAPRHLLEDGGKSCWRW